MPPGLGSCFVRIPIGMDDSNHTMRSRLARRPLDSMIVDDSDRYVELDRRCSAGLHLRRLFNQRGIDPGVRAKAAMLFCASATPPTIWRSVSATKV